MNLLLFSKESNKILIPKIEILDLYRDRISTKIFKYQRILYESRDGEI